MPFTVETTDDQANARPEPRPTGLAMKRGALGRCPACGEGRLWSSYLKTTPACERCGLAIDGAHRADDLPAYGVMMIVGHVLVPAALMLEKGFHPPLWVHMAAWLPLSVVLSLALLPIVKGAVVGLQWAKRMHDFGESPRGAEA